METDPPVREPIAETLGTTKRTLYVACGLTQAPPEFRHKVASFKDYLRTQGHVVLDFLGLEDGTAADVYNWDINHCVADCDALVAICDYPSIGVGMEIMAATNRGKPALAAVHVDKYAATTRMIPGWAAVEQNAQMEQYTDLRDLTPRIDIMLTQKTI